MGKGRRGGDGETAAARQAAEDEKDCSALSLGGGHDRGRGRVVPTSSDAKKMRSLEEMMVIGDLQISSTGGMGQMMAGVAQVGPISSFSSPLLSSLSGERSIKVAGVEQFANVEEGVVEEVEDEEEEEEWAELGSGPARMGKMRTGSVQGRCSMPEDVSQVQQHAHHLFDGMLHRPSLVGHGVVTQAVDWGAELRVEETGVETMQQRGGGEGWRTPERGGGSDWTCHGGGEGVWGKTIWKRRSQI